MKRVVTLGVLSALAAFTLWAGDGSGAWNDGKITWEYTLDESGATIVYVSETDDSEEGLSGALEIPAKVGEEGYSVVAIGEGAFEDEPITRIIQDF